MEKIWVNSYQNGVPAEINPDAYSSIVELFQVSTKQFAKRRAFYMMGTTLSFEEIDKASRNFAAYLQQNLQLKKGDRIAIMLPNVLQFPIAFIGALRAGLIIINVNPLYTPDELVFQLNDSGAVTLLYLSNFTNTVQQALPRLPLIKNLITSDFTDLLNQPMKFIAHFVMKYIKGMIPKNNIDHAIRLTDALSQGKCLALARVEILSTDIALLQYTGGTTGKPKAAMLTHRNIIASLQQLDAWISVELQSRINGEIVIAPLPFYHIFALTVNLLYFPLKIGCLSVLIPNPRDIKDFIHILNKFNFTAIIGINTLLKKLLEAPSFTKINFSPSLITIIGGMPGQKSLFTDWANITKSPLREGYGLTETCATVSCYPLNQAHYNGSVGLPFPSTDICILDDEHHPLPIGEVGEVAIKGPQVMSGYWHTTDETSHAFTSDGWLLSGDIGKLDNNGYLYLLDRKKDMIIVSGFKIYPCEIESVIEKIDGIFECAVIGIPDEKTGEAVKAVVATRDKSITADTILNYCRKFLTLYKIPKVVEFRDSLPKSNVGKILKRELR